MEIFPALWQNVAAALAEDIGEQDWTAQLLAPTAVAHATVIARQAAVICGQAWFEACFRALDSNVEINWCVAEGELVAANAVLCELRGQARAVVTAERSGLNFLQTLSATATRVRQFVQAIEGTRAKIMDTRKTLPGLRMAQKYAVRVGGGHNQRAGLFDGVLIKENHILAAGGIAAVLAQAKAQIPSHIPVQIEVESLDELVQALNAGARLVLLDNMNNEQLTQAVTLVGEHAQLEASGGINLDNVVQIAQTGVHRISVGHLTKNISAIDLSLRVQTF